MSVCLANIIALVCIFATELPRLSHPPMIVSRTRDSITVRWSKWHKPIDQGDGPVTHYQIKYRLTTSQSWDDIKIDDTSGSLPTMEAELTKLKSGNAFRYEIAIVPIRKDGLIGVASPPIESSTCEGNSKSIYTYFLCLCQAHFHGLL